MLERLSVLHTHPRPWFARSFDIVVAFVPGESDLENRTRCIMPELYAHAFA